MGTAYCLQYMHHDLNPPVAHTKVNSKLIMLTDDYAAKVHTYIYIFLCSFIIFFHLYVNHQNY
jgi:hypothetical protein